MRKIILVLGILVASIVTYYSLGYFIKLHFARQYAVANADKIKLLLVWGNGYGEREQTYRFRIVGERLGVDLRVVSNETNYITRHYLPNKLKIAAEIMQPDLILTIERDIPFIFTAPNFLVLDQSKDAYFNSSESSAITKTMLYRLHRYAGLLPTFPEINLLQDAFANGGYNFQGFTWYPTVYATDYPVQKPKKLFYPGGILRDITRSSEKYKQMFMLLDQKDYFAVYGQKSKWQHTPRSLQAPIAFDGISLIRIQNAAGISLVLHDAEHLHGNVPSGRIFEAAAANTVIISDKLRFIEDNFGNNVLYVDVDAEPHQIAEQIDKHVKWIFANPELAHKMAENCHAIFLEKFTLEKQVEKLLDLI